MNARLVSRPKQHLVTKVGLKNTLSPHSLLIVPNQLEFVFAIARDVPGSCRLEMIIQTSRVRVEWLMGRVFDRSRTSLASFNSQLRFLAWVQGFPGFTRRNTRQNPCPACLYELCAVGMNRKGAIGTIMSGFEVLHVSCCNVHGS